ncbi:MAG: ABC transporter permease [Rhodospirillaceae bacterium]|jgi:peptide/nickel transport system permease protein|nr:ABC transporter permease [Rhodospirillaceae bacterium]
MAVNETYIGIQDDLIEERTWSSVAADLIRRQPLGAIGGLVVVLMIAAALFAEQISMYDPEVNDFGAMLEAPSWAHLFGTDEFGRDIYSRIVHGARTAMLVGFTAAILGSTIGLLIGVTSAYFGGWVDIIVQRVVDVLIAFPSIILALAIVIILGRGVGPVIVAITIPLIPNCARVVRSSALAIREIPYVDAARAMGFGHTRIVLRHISPNIMAPYLIMLTTFLGQAILAEASLSYLGLGVQEPTAAWGLMLKSGAEEYAESAPWAVIFPGVAISLAVFGFNLFGDAMRDVLDPKLRDR